MQMTDHPRRWLVSTEWLAAHLSAPDIVIVDASWHLPGSGRDAYQEYLEARIPGAVFFDIDEIADSESPLPHMLPSPVKFSARMRKMGIGDGMRIIVYDSDGIAGAAARVWWTFRAMGVDDVAVLDGGLAKWEDEDRPTEEGPPVPRSARHFTARRNAELIADRAMVEAALADPAIQVFDVRSAERYSGAAPEPRPGLARGHMPGARNLPFARLLNQDGTLKGREEIAAILDAHALDRERPVICSCGSGVTACVLALALAELAHPRVAVYDGSWAEWGADPSAPIETGPDPAAPEDG